MVVSPSQLMFGVRLRNRAAVGRVRSAPAQSAARRQARTAVLP